MIFGVDGTGPFWNKVYNLEMSNSFVSKICGGVKSPTYWRGPDAIDTFLGGPNPRVVAEAIRMAVVPNAAPAQLGLSPFGAPAIVYPTSSTELSGLKDKVFLTGYSRGAATVLDAAVFLKEYGIPVEAIFLFDSVTRSPWLSGKVIPDNVKACYHAMRNELSKSRRSFGNSQVVCENSKKTKYEADNTFRTTHAGMGGTPWGEKGLLKPLTTLNRIVDVATGGALQTPTDRAREMLTKYPEKYADKIFEGVPDWAFTDVTVRQEAAGMAVVCSWMGERLALHGISPPK